MEQMMSIISLVLYVTTWIVTISIYQRKKKHFDVGSVILYSYLIFSFSSLILFINPFYNFKSLDLFPFIYLYMMLMVIFWPILKYDDAKIKEIQKPTIIFFNTVSIIFIVSSLVHLPTIISEFSFGIRKLFFYSYGGQELYDYAMYNSYSYGDGNITNLAAIISGTFTNLGILLLFYYLTLKKHNKFLLFGLFLSTIISILTFISMGQRGPIVEKMLVMVITFFALRKFLQPKIKKFIAIIGLVLFFTILVPLFALTVSRFENSIGGYESSLYYYAGQANLYFNNYGLDNGGIRYGDRTFPLFKRMLGFDNVPRNFWERRIKYSNLKINDEVFYTFVGDFTIDFGPALAPLFFILFTIFVLKKTEIRNNRLLFHQLIPIHFVLCMCIVGGIKLYSFSDVGGNLQLIVYFLAFIGFRLDYELQKKKQVLNS